MPRRSRGCAACRQRRIGCDGGLPECRQCLITNRQCSGPLQGAFIIDQTDHVVSRNQPPRPARESPLVPQPSSQSMSAHVFISEFVSFITARNEEARRRSWLTELQQGSVVDEGEALDLSMQATALAYCGAGSKNPAAVREACNIYGRALTKHSRSIAHKPTLQRAASLCTCVMLSLFEAVWSTSSVAYGMHLRAAQEMLALGPPAPGLGHEEVIFQLGQHVYCQTLFVMLATPQQYVEHAPTPVSWAKMPSVENIGTAQVINRLMFDLFYLTDVLARRTCNANGEAVVVSDVGPEVEELWQEFQQQATRSGELIQWPTPSGTGYLDPFTAMIVAYFNAARVLQGVLGSQIGSSTVDASCDSILQSCYFLEGKNIGCAYLRMFFPLMLVAMHGSSSGQQAAAYGVLEQWLSNTAFKGVAKIAVSRVQSSTGFRMPVFNSIVEVA
ncbi:hypothetical protein FDECE_1814 [Fusarium decemcellulare]|nr:hypothetical protein FDECE_1814 [Fusarium decemcellulare]